MYISIVITLFLIHLNISYLNIQFLYIHKIRRTAHPCLTPLVSSTTQTKPPVTPLRYSHIRRFGTHFFSLTSFSPQLSIRTHTERLVDKVGRVFINSCSLLYKSGWVVLVLLLILFYFSNFPKAHEFSYYDPVSLVSTLGLVPSLS